MSVEQKVSPPRVKAQTPAKTAAKASDSRDANLMAGLVDQTPGVGVRIAARAPRRLDVIGGIIEYSGGLVASMTLNEEVVAVVRRREDGLICLQEYSQTEPSRNGPAVFRVDQLCGDDALAAQVQSEDSAGGNQTGGLARSAMATMAEGVRAGAVALPAGGISLSLALSVDGRSCFDLRSACCAAVLGALASLNEVELDPIIGAKVCQRVHNGWFDSPQGLVDGYCSLAGEENLLTLIRCLPCCVGPPSAIPPGFRLIGVDCGTEHPSARQKYRQVRTASFMGCLIVDRIAKHDQDFCDTWDGHLSDLTVADYVRLIRDRVPTKMSGGEFLKRFGETGDPLTRIDPDDVYKIRSRTEHHIYEHERACRFAALMSEIAGSASGAREQAALEAGELMYASHWSYGQRCGLGSIEADKFVNLIRQQGTTAGLYGAKLTGPGCNAPMAVFMLDSDGALQALTQCVEAYQEQTGLKARLLYPGTAGVLRNGIHSF